MIRGTTGLHPAPDDPQCRWPVCLCDRCGGELYPGEIGYLWKDQQLCPDCFKTAVTVWLEDATHQFAAALGVQTRVL